MTPADESKLGEEDPVQGPIGPTREMWENILCSFAFLWHMEKIPEMGQKDQDTFFVLIRTLRTFWG